MLKTVDLFAGAGGLSYGFELTNQFLIVAAAENNKNASKTYVENHKGCGDIIMIPDVRGYNFKDLAEKIGEIDVVIGGPPCQGFSNANRQKNHIISMNNSLVKEYFRAIKEIEPRAFVMENVSMLSSDTHRFYDSYCDHEVIEALGIKKRDDDLVISEGDYDEVNLMDIFDNGNEDKYRINDELFQLLNVLYKNRSNEDRLPKYIKKNGQTIVRKIEQCLHEDLFKFDILINTAKYIHLPELHQYFEELGLFIKFQKSFRLRDELIDNEIIYKFQRNPNTGAITATVKSYAVIDYINKILGDDYVINSGEINSLWFGVPQERKRYIVLGVKSDELKAEKIEMPKDRHLPVVNVGQAIMDLAVYKVTDDVGEINEIPYIGQENLSKYAVLMRQDSTGVNNHIVPKTREKAKKRFEALNEGENFHKLSEDMKDNYADPARTQNSIYLKLDSLKPSGTVINVRKSMWIHPTLNRAISVREAARLQSFPDSFIFKGTKDSQYQQVGNAVPILMAKGIAEEILKYL
ncbi:DNA methyltransferase [Anaerocolumna cellulosilytica]|uniref:DNA methyltransferase n=1 Tax=Anaerocolumna cellulosilytica TaxID=433286 RepID=A0A6S6QV69_9FIRM|nr:DNA cytosine methyltransferase [Anaerocolumna cellulosilytica]MBB5194631.1 DNA (cytosine-5)-methyltransferase 1 [Anaerocolumna cellulosilytica]BCJ93576.1 DNA methyltransferase [Anaerocolumna cellulosilytica]